MDTQPLNAVKQRAEGLINKSGLVSTSTIPVYYSAYEVFRVSESRVSTV